MLIISTCWLLNVIVQYTIIDGFARRLSPKLKHKRANQENSKIEKTHLSCLEQLELFTCKFWFGILWFSKKNSFLRKYFIHNFSTFFYDSSSTEKTFGRQKTILLTRREAPYRICCLHLWYRCTQERQTLGFIVAREIKRWKWRKKQRKVNLVQESSWFKE